MKLNFRLIILLIVLSFSLKNVSAQYDSAYFKYSIKTSTLQWLVLEPNIGFEYRFSAKFGIENTLGFFVNPQNRHIYLGTQTLLTIPHKGFVWRCNPKFYFPEYKTYLSPMLLVRHSYIEGVFNTGTIPYPSMNFLKDERWVFETGLLFGGEAASFKHFNAELFGGIGLRRRNQSITYYNNAPDPFNHEYPYTTNDILILPTIHFGVKIGLGFNSLLI